MGLLSILWQRFSQPLFSPGLSRHPRQTLIKILILQWWSRYYITYAANAKQDLCYDLRCHRCNVGPRFGPRNSHGWKLVSKRLSRPEKRWQSFVTNGAAVGLFMTWQTSIQRSRSVCVDVNPSSGSHQLFHPWQWHVCLWVTERSVVMHTRSLRRLLLLIPVMKGTLMKWEPKFALLLARMCLASWPGWDEWEPSITRTRGLNYRRKEGWELISTWDIS